MIRSGAQRFAYGARCGISMPSNIQNATSVCRSRTVVSDVLDRVKGVYQPAYVSIAGGKLMALLVSLFITLIVLLICREIVCWYWKINEALTTLKAIDEKLSVQINILTRSPQRNP
jgi:hypothetical protein